MRKVLYFLIAASFFAAQIFTIDFSFFQLSLFRITIIIAPILLILYSLKASEEIYIIPNERNKYSIVFMLVWLLYSILSLLWVEDYGLAIRSIYFISSGVICIILFSIFFKKKVHFRISFNVMQIMILMHNLIGWYEIITRDYRFMSIDNITYYSSTKGIPVSMLGNPNDFATLALFGVFISYICFNINRSLLAKSISLGLILSNIILIFMTNSRANIIGLLIAFVLFLVLQKKSKLTISISLVLSLFLILIIFKPEILQTLMMDINNAFNFDFNTKYLNSEGTRLNLIKNGFNFLASTFGFGTGTGNIEYWMQYRAKYPTRYVTNIHNWWMEILTGYGIIIFLLYIKFYLKLFKDMLKIYKSTSDYFNRTISLGILACMTGFVVAGISSSSNISKEWLWVFWAVTIAFQGFSSDNNVNAKIK